jgi:hypothetical protein
MGKSEKRLRGLVGKTFRQASLQRELAKALPGTLWDWYPCEGGLVITTTFGQASCQVSLKNNRDGRDGLTVSGVAFTDDYGHTATQTSGIAGKEGDAWENTRAQGLQE